MKILLVLSALLVAGCAQNPPVKLPELRLSSHWRAGPTVEATGESWWKAFADENLNRLESLALAENLDLQQAVARLEQAQAAAGITDAATAPAVNLEGSAGRVRQSLNAGFGTLANFNPAYARTVNPAQLGFNGTWDLDFAGGLRHQREAAGATVQASAAEWQSLRLAISAEVADSYFVMQGVRLQKHALEKQLELLATQLHIMEVRVQTGAASEAELDRLKATVEESTAPLAMLNATVTSQKNKLAVLLGKNPTDWEPALDNLIQLAIFPDPAGGVPVEILRRRPDVLAAEQRVAVAAASVAASMAEYYPKISLSAAIGQDSSNYSHLDSSRSSFAQSFLGLRWRLFDFGRIDAEVKVAQGKQKEALLAYRSAVLRAAADVETSFAQLAAARERLKHLLEEGKRLQQVAQSVQNAYKTGAVSKDEVCNAERNVAHAEFDQAAANVELAHAIVVAARALGGPIEN